MNDANIKVEYENGLKEDEPPPVGEFFRAIIKIRNKDVINDYLNFLTQSQTLQTQVLLAAHL